jgi:hypothetical protein
MENSELIDYRLYNPSNSIFKGSGNDKAKFTRLYCSNSSNCGAFKQGACPMWNFGGEKCPYGRKTIEEGYTKRARKFHAWIQERKNLVKEIKQLADCKKMCMIGEYIYLPYPYWTLDRSIKVEKRSSLFSSGQEFIKKELFTIDFFQQLVTAQPKAFMGGLITSYEEKVVPKIINHCREVMPEFFTEWENKYPKTAIKFKDINHVGRKARANTLKIGCEIQIDNKTAIWNGNEFVFGNFPILFSPIKAAKTYVKIVPTEGASVEITDNAQVCESTEFID